MHVGQRICEGDYIILRLCEFLLYGQPKGGREFRPLYLISCVYLVKNPDPDIDHGGSGGRFPFYCKKDGVRGVKKSNETPLFKVNRQRKN